MTDITEHKGADLTAVEAKDFKFDVLRASVFVPEIQYSASDLFRRLPDRWLQLFDADPTIIPVPAGAPPTIPIMNLNDKSGNRRFGISRIRIDFEQITQSIEQPIEACNSFYEEAIDYILEFVDKFDITIKRLASNVNRFTKHQDPGLYLSRHFCKKRWYDDAPLNRPTQFEMSSHKRFDLYGDETLFVNSWVRNKTGKSLSSDEPLIIVEQDINTLPEEIDRVFEPDELKRFFNHNVRELEHILSLYYPNEK